MITEVVKIFDQDLFENIQVGDHDVGLLANVVPRHIIIERYKYKNKGIAVPQSGQSRVVGILMSTIHPYACISQLSY